MEHILRGYVKYRKRHFGYDSLFSRIRIAFLFLCVDSQSALYLHFISIPLSEFTGLSTLLGQGISGSGTEVRRLGYFSGTEVGFPMRFWSHGIA